MIKYIDDSTSKISTTIKNKKIEMLNTKYVYAHNAKNFDT